ncbi:hypothetical protein [Plantactinospora mayteni]|uniref:hypothetical protein n=1 Tax=Plantactinospora mayteni TaxID=566021 RepID=UPI0019421CDE|nr:hypothetical protein [Plantactinospora mayteni]
MVTTGGLLVGLAAVSVPAQAGEGSASPLAAPGNWNVTEISEIPPGLLGLTKYSLVEPTSSGDVLVAAEDHYRQPDDRQPIRCWNGTDWTEIPKPAMTGDAGTQYRALGGASCTDFYVFDNADVPQRWHWNGSWWLNAPTGSRYPVDTVRAFAANDIWAFSSIASQGFHFNGTSWRQISIPVMDVDVAVGVSSSDFWLLGSVPNSSALLAYRRNGTTWTKGSLPATYKGYLHSTAGAASNNLYVLGTTMTPGYLRWDGTSWRHEQAPSGLTGYPQDIAYAGGTLWVTLGSGFLRLSNGQWSKEPYPVVDNPYGLHIFGLATDPRTETIFGAGYVGNSEVGGIRKAIIENVAQAG